MFQPFIRYTPYAWMSSANRDEAFDQGLQIPRLLAPEVRGFFFNFQGRVVRPERAVDELAAFDGDVGEVGWRSGGCESGFKDSWVKVGDCGDSVAAEPGCGVCLLEFGANKAGG